MAAAKTMKIENKSIKDLIQAEYNPRQLSKEQFNTLKDSLVEFGFVDPVIINSNPDRKNIIIGGHQRVKVAKEIGIKEVPCFEINLSLEKEKELNVRLNKNTGDWDWDLLANNFDVENLLEWGFNEDELDFEAPEKEGKTADDQIPEEVEAICKEGDLWQLGEHRLLCGDATKEEDVELLMNGEKADMVFTDPPYNIDYQSNGRKVKFDKIKNDNIFIKEWIDFVNKYSSGFVYVWTSWKVFDVWSNLCKAIGNLSNVIIWFKNKGGLGDLEKTFSSDYEMALVYNRNNKIKGKRIGSVWQINPDNAIDYKHPTQKPVELAEIALNNTSSLNDIILDFFLGSGSTLIACEKTNRKCYGLELDPHYCDVIIKRWEEYTGGKAEKI